MVADSYSNKPKYFFVLLLKCYRRPNQKEKGKKGKNEERFLNCLLQCDPTTLPGTMRRNHFCFSGWPLFGRLRGGVHWHLPLSNVWCSWTSCSWKVLGVGWMRCGHPLPNAQMWSLLESNTIHQLRSLGEQVFLWGGKQWREEQRNRPWITSLIPDSIWECPDGLLLAHMSSQLHLGPSGHQCHPGSPSAQLHIDLHLQRLHLHHSYPGYRQGHLHLPPLTPPWACILSGLWFPTWLLLLLVPPSIITNMVPALYLLHAILQSPLPPSAVGLMALGLAFQELRSTVTVMICIGLFLCHFFLFFLCLVACVPFAYFCYGFWFMRTRFSSY